VLYPDIIHENYRSNSVTQSDLMLFEHYVYYHKSCTDILVTKNASTWNIFLACMLKTNRGTDSMIWFCSARFYDD
jgi:hypothetical protein